VIGDAVFDFDPDLDDLPPDERAEILAAEAEDDPDDTRPVDVRHGGRRPDGGDTERGGGPRGGRVTARFPRPRWRW
jgi:hypothetical protein